MGDAAGIVGAILGAVGGVLALWTTWTKAKTEARISNIKAEAEARANQIKMESEARANQIKFEAESIANETRRRASELDYVISQYRDTVERVKKEHAEDRAYLQSLQAEHIHCREKLATMEERQGSQEKKIVSQQAEIDFLRKRLVELQSAGQTNGGF